MPLDNEPNWLLSTAAQSAAALVAIVGGFLVSRVIAISTDRQGLDRRLRELQERLALKRSQLEEVYVERFAVTVEWFEEHHLGDYVAARGSVGAVAKSLYSEQAWIPLGSTAEEMRPYADGLAGGGAKALDVLETSYRGTGGGRR